MKIISWNVNGIRAAVKKGFFESMIDMQTDILCLQETKAQEDQVAEALEGIDYHIYSNSAEKKGYSGTCILSKEKAISVSYGIDAPDHDREGRVLTAEYPGFYLVNVYVPNSKNDLSRLEYRAQWDADFLSHLKSLEAKKPVVVCGDFNVAHKDIDLARPDANYNKSAGYTQKEIDGMDNYLAAGFYDSFRLLHPNEVKYSWWSYRAGARERNVGWRIDYVLLSKGLLEKIDSAFIFNEIEGSDHCPVGVSLVLS